MLAGAATGAPGIPPSSPGGSPGMPLGTPAGGDKGPADAFVCASTPAFVSAAVLAFVSASCFPFVSDSSGAWLPKRWVHSAASRESDSSSRSKWLACAVPRRSGNSRKKNRRLAAVPTLTIAALISEPIGRLRMDGNSNPNIENLGLGGRTLGEINTRKPRGCTRETDTSASCNVRPNAWLKAVFMRACASLISFCASALRSAVCLAAVSERPPRISNIERRVSHQYTTFSPARER